MTWFEGPIKEAIVAVKQQKKTLLVLVKGDDQESSTTYSAFDDERVKEALNSCICLCLEANSSEATQFSAIYPVTVVPSIYLIDSQGNPLEVLSGQSSVEQIVEKVFPRVAPSTSDKPAEPVATPGPSQEVPSNSVNNEEPTISPEASSSSPASLEERVLHARQRLEAKKAEKEREEAERLRQKELERREVGKLMLDTKRNREEQARLEAIAERRKEIDADRLHREKIKRQLEEDRRERAARRGLPVTAVADASNHASASTMQTAPSTSLQGEASTSCRLQLRFPDGATFVHNFHAQDDTLGSVRQYLQQEALAMNSQQSYRWVADGAFSLASTYPRRDFHSEDECRTLLDLGLSPSSALLVLPLGSRAISSGGSGGAITRGTMVLSDLTMSIWRMVCSLFSFLASILPFNVSPSSNASSSATSPRAESKKVARTPPSAAGADSKRGTSDRAPESETRLRREHRLHDLRRDDDDEATWNGNSTQQM